MSAVETQPTAATDKALLSVNIEVIYDHVILVPVNRSRCRKVASWRSSG